LRFLKILSPEERKLVESFCGGCKNLKFKRVTRHCLAFTSFFPLWSKSNVQRSCPAFLVDLPVPIKSSEIRAVLAEERKRGKPGGGGEKADRTNKLFGPARMKDNSIKWSWDEL